MPGTSAPATTRKWWQTSRRGAQVAARRYHFHGPGVAYAATLIVIMLGAINGQNNVLFWLFGLGVAGLLVSGILSGAALMGLEVEREVPSRAVRLETFTIRYRLRNRSWLIPAFALTIEELPTAVRGRPAGTWNATIPHIATFASNIPVRGEGASLASVTPDRHGRYTFGAVRVSTTFPFGLARKSVTFWAPAEVLVLPRCPAVSAPALEGLSHIGRREGSARRARGGEEFFALREYVPGDPVRLIASRASARQEQLIVRELAEAGAQHFTIVPDLPDDPEQRERTTDAAAGLAKAALERGMHVGVRSADGTLQTLTRGGSRHLAPCLEVLALSGGGPITPAQGHRGLVVIVGDGPQLSQARGELRLTPEALGVQADSVPQPVATLGLRARAAAFIRRWT